MNAIHVARWWRDDFRANGTTPLDPMATARRVAPNASPRLQKKIVDILTAPEPAREPVRVTTPHVSEEYLAALRLEQLQTLAEVLASTVARQWRYRVVTTTRYQGGKRRHARVSRVIFSHANGFATENLRPVVAQVLEKRLGEERAEAQVAIERAQQKAARPKHKRGKRGGRRRAEARRNQERSELAKAQVIGLSFEARQPVVVHVLVAGRRVDFECVDDKWRVARVDGEAVSRGAYEGLKIGYPSAETLECLYSDLFQLGAAGALLKWEGKRMQFSEKNPRLA